MLSLHVLGPNQKPYRCKTTWQLRLPLARLIWRLRTRIMPRVTVNVAERNVSIPILGHGLVIFLIEHIESQMRPRVQKPNGSFCGRKLIHHLKHPFGKLLKVQILPQMVFLIRLGHDGDSPLDSPGQTDLCRRRLQFFRQSKDQGVFSWEWHIGIGANDTDRTAPEGLVRHKDDTLLLAEAQ
jgi:hypothetical protein